MDMHISEPENSLEYARGMSCDLLHSVECALGHCPWESRNLFDTDNPRICDDDDIELVIDPVEKDKRQKYYPVECQSSPVDTTSYYIYDSELVRNEYPWSQKECYTVKKMKNQNNPVSMNSHYDMLIIF